MQLKTIFIIITIFLTTSPLLYSDSTNTVIDTSSAKSKSQLVEGEDNFDTHYTFNTEDKQQKWYESSLLTTLIGAFFGAFFAAIIALLVVNRTHKKNKEIEAKRENDAIHKVEEKYTALLFGIYSEIQANEELVKIIKEGIKSYLDHVESQNKLIATDVFNTLKINFVEQCRLNMINNESFSPNVLRWVSKYIYKVDEINGNLESNKIMQIPNHLHPGDSLFDAMTIYFNEILDNIKDLEEGSIELKRIILHDHQNFPHCKLQFTDNSLTESSNTNKDNI